jgi:hypothetical protein
MVIAAVGLAVVLGCAVAAQAPQGAPPPPPPPRAAGPIDLTGYWVSIVNEDWRWRMVTPPKGDYASVPLSADGRAEADKWTPAMDGRCEAYGAGGVMRMPTRVHITWQDDNTLKVETDAGTQTRLFHFGGNPPPSSDRSLQGYSVAVWEFAGGRGVGPGGRGGPPGPGGLPGGPPPGAAPGTPPAGAPAAGREGRGDGRGALPRFGSLKVVTTNLLQGWVRRNGVPYSESTTVTEYYDRFKSTNGDEWFFVTTVVNDPKYLAQEFVTSSHFKKEPDGSKWSPSPCKAS